MNISTACWSAACLIQTSLWSDFRMSSRLMISCLHFHPLALASGPDNSLTSHRSRSIDQPCLLKCWHAHAGSLAKLVQQQSQAGRPVNSHINMPDSQLNWCPASLPNGMTTCETGPSSDRYEARLQVACAGLQERCMQLQAVCPCLDQAAVLTSC